jgi:hypothetical protein
MKAVLTLEMAAFVAAIVGIALFAAYANGHTQIIDQIRDFLAGR